MVYKSFLVPVPGSWSRENMNSFLRELIEAINRNIERHEHDLGSEPNVLMIPPNAPVEELQDMLHEHFNVVVYRNSAHTFGLTRR